MAIQHRRGLKVDFDPNKMLPGEFAYALDTAELFYCYSTGNVKKLATIEDLQILLDTNETAYTALQQLIAELENETVLTGILSDISNLQDNKLDKTGVSSNNTVIFSEATEDEDIVSGETHTTLFGKILKSIKTFRDGLATHVAENATDAHGITPAVKVRNTSNISIPNDTTTTLTYNTEDYDTHDLHSTTINPSRLTCKHAGKYLIVANVRFAINPTGERVVEIRRSGSLAAQSRVGANPVAGTGRTVLNVTTVEDLNVGDYLEVSVFQNSGSSLDVESVTNTFMMVKVG